MSSELQNLGTRITSTGRGIGLKINRALTQTLQSCDERAVSIKLDGDNNSQIIVNNNRGDDKLNENEHIYRSNNSINNTATTRSSTPVIWGTSQFNLDINVVTDGQGTIIKAVGTRNGVKTQLRCTWRRKFGEHQADAHHHSEAYRLTADDLGCKLVCEAFASGSVGAAYAELGPFEITDILRNELQRLNSE